MGRPKPKKKQPHRVCEECGTWLSRYNPGKKCFRHDGIRTEEGNFDRNGVPYKTPSTSPEQPLLQEERGVK